MRVDPNEFRQQVLDHIGLERGFAYIRVSTVFILVFDRSLGRPEYGDARTGRDLGTGRGVTDNRLLPDLIDREQDAMLDATRLDPSLALALAAEHVGHRQDGLQRVALAATRRTDIRLAGRNPDVIVDDAGDGFGRNAGAIVLEDNARWLGGAPPRLGVAGRDRDLDDSARMPASSQASMPLSTSSLAMTLGHS